ncbi:MAG: hypothetical protein KIT84_28600 [Labilithrix sp.]|nr:hypothetical protein [Labilithrix sp.]MCW5815020.1 hypothetical protein [Labilithrix sp.]
MRPSFEWLVAIAMAVAACSPAPAPVASSSRDPSNPAAPESVDPVAALNVAVAPADAGPVVYACPMHPEVTADHATKCPKCGMTLAPKK